MINVNVVTRLPARTFLLGGSSALARDMDGEDNAKTPMTVRLGVMQPSALFARDVDGLWATLGSAWPGWD